MLAPPIRQKPTLTPSKVEFKVNHIKTDYSMKLGEAGEAFFVFETSGIVPADMQTSPLVSPVTSPNSEPSQPGVPSLQEPDFLDIADSGGPKIDRTQSDFGEQFLSRYGRAVLELTRCRN